MTSREEVNNLLRFFTQDAKIPLARSLSLIKKLQGAEIMSIQQIAGAKVEELTTTFDDAKLGRQVLLAAKRAAKQEGLPPLEKKKNARARAGGSSLQSPVSQTPSCVFKLDPKVDLSLPEPVRDEGGIKATTLLCNRAPVLLAFVFKLLQYTNPQQPIASRLSLAGAVIATIGKAKAVDLGIQQGTGKVDTEGLGEVFIMGNEIRTIRRIADETESTQGTEMGDSSIDPVWAIDLDAWSKSGIKGYKSLDLPIHTPQNARSYLKRSFPDDKLALVFGALDLLFEHWVEKVGIDGIDSKAWGWYATIRPSIPGGTQGWGAKGDLKLGEILRLRT